LTKWDKSGKDRKGLETRFLGEKKRVFDNSFMLLDFCTKMAEPSVIPPVHFTCDHFEVSLETILKSGSFQIFKKLISNKKIILKKEPFFNFHEKVVSLYIFSNFLLFL